MQRFWLVWGVGQAVPRKRHPSFEIASLEAKRLAEKHVNVRFVVLESKVVYEAKAEATCNYTGDFRDSYG